MVAQTGRDRKRLQDVGRRSIAGPLPLFVLALLLFTGLVACTKVTTGLKVLAHRPQGNPAMIHAGRYESDPDHRFLMLEVEHLGFSRVLARFENWHAFLEIDPDAPEHSRVSAEITASSFSTGVPAIDERVAELLKSKRHPTIRFVSQKLEPSGPAEVQLSGTLTIAGRSAPVSMRVVFNGAGQNPLTGRYTLGFSAIGSLDRTRWGLGKWVPAVGRRVNFRVEAEFVGAAIHPGRDDGRR